MKALVIDDSAIIRSMVKDMLSEIGFEVNFASDGSEALPLLQDTSSHFDIVLLDWNMPEMNGPDLLKALGEDMVHQQVVVMMTTETKLEYIMEAMRLGAKEYIMKPFTADILKEKISIAAGF